METQVDAIRSTLRALRVSVVTQEFDLHEQIAAALAAAGIPYIHEARLAPRCRIDFLCDGIGLEVKRGRPNRSTLLAQLNRYCACPQITALILVVERSANLPSRVHGKPITVLSLNRLWGVSLP